MCAWLLIKIQNPFSSKNRNNPQVEQEISTHFHVSSLLLHTFPDTSGAGGCFRGFEQTASPARFSQVSSFSYTPCKCDAEMPSQYAVCFRDVRTPGAL